MTKEINKQLKIFKKWRQDRINNYSQFTHARVGLGHTGGHVKLADWLRFQAHFALAKDALFGDFPLESLLLSCKLLDLEALEVHSQPNDLMQFLLRPDLGKRLAIESQNKIEQFIAQEPDRCNQDMLIVISGGLSPVAIEKQIPSFLPLLINAAKKHFSLAPVIINPKGRVALGDQINAYFKAKIVLMLIGERPGLSSFDSMGLYFTYDARPGCTDEQRNCISNIHQNGLTHQEAVSKLIVLLQKAMKRKLTGVALKDNTSNIDHY